MLSLSKHAPAAVGGLSRQRLETAKNAKKDGKKSLRSLRSFGFAQDKPLWLNLQCQSSIFSEGVPIPKGSLRLGTIFNLYSYRRASMGSSLEALLAG